MSEQILSRICEIAGDVLEAPVQSDSSPATIESWDSVRHLTLITAVEDEYGFMFLPEEMDKAQSIGKIAELVASKRA